MLPLTLFSILSASAVIAHDTRLKDENGNYLGRGCGTEEYNEALLANDPDWQASLDEFEEQWALKSAALQSGEETYQLNSVNLPVVFHIVSTNPNNVPDSAIAYQLNVLQEDYTATNSDYTSGTPVEFRSVRSGNTGITFTTQQVIRRTTTVSSFSSNNNIKFTSSGGSDVVSPNQYLNYWAGVLSGGLLGYAQFPGGSSSTDGVVQGIGTMSPEVGSEPYCYGRTATHEVGHWLNLRHIWGDNSGCTNTASISDFVLDTPPSSSSNFGCPAGTKRCSSNSYSQDMYMNYMDYVYDQCMVMFTQLQTARAWASIDQYRQGFNPTSTADTEYINWLYFNRFEDEEPADDDKCFGDHVLFYDNDINEESDSNIYIYGCMLKTTNMNVHHMVDIDFVNGADTECEDGYTRASQDLNEGNEDNEIYLCYKKEEPDTDNPNLAILDITFIKDDDSSKLSGNGWEINTEDNINPNGIKLNLAIQIGEYSALPTLEAIMPNISTNDEGINKEWTYIGIASGLGLIGIIMFGVIMWRYVCSRKGFKDYINESLTADEYGSTPMELKEIQ